MTAMDNNSASSGSAAARCGGNVEGGSAGRILAIGVFDLFHVGHLRYLQYARRQGHYLMVAMTSDALSLERKGKWPVIEQSQRMEIVRGLGWVDEVGFIPASVELTDAAAQWIAAWGPDLVVVGGEWQGAPRWQRLTPALAERGIRVGFAPHTQGISSTVIVTKIRTEALALTPPVFARSGR